jgi:DNA-binding CsgD family transcriptional regulator
VVQETEILRQITEGKSKEEIAGAMEMSEETLVQKLGSIRHKLVANEQKLMLIEAAQRSLPPISRFGPTSRPAADYITKEEFAAFKESLKDRFKSLSGEIS